MSGLLLQIEGLRKDYGARRILDIESLALHAGESYVLTGDNGAGKSTLLRILAGLESAQVAKYLFEGYSVSLENYPQELRCEIIYVHQHPYLFKTSITGNITYGLKARGVPKLQREALVKEAMEWAGVANLDHVPPQKLSGGEKQRVALARAKVLNPKLFLLDEPTANLDAEARRQTIELIQRLCLDNNCVLIACHDYELINLPRMRRMTLAEGRLVPQVATAR
ncbi:MAG TPA: ABC transporter ATP-binding protein [Burkholderiales bacterium]